MAFTGRAAHAGGFPEQGKNALLAAASAALALHAIPRHGGGQSFINVGTLRAGSGRNVVPDHALMQVEVRGETTEINRFMMARTEEICRGAAAMRAVRAA
ncbi:MAG: peptidase dimerization domain-containing protein [Christensenellales bacterium]